MANKIVTPSTLVGFMELLPKDQVIFDKIKAQMERIYSSYGFFPLDTPIMEKSEILLAKTGGDTEKQIYRAANGNSKEENAIRFDLTVPLAKYVAKNYSDLTFPFKRYQIGKVYRGERPQRGRFREFYQADIDIIGDGTLSIRNDAEIPSIIYSLFKSLGINDFTIRINNRKVLNGLFALLGFAENATEVMRTIDKLDKIGREKVTEILVSEQGLPQEQVEELLNVMTSEGTAAEIIEMLKNRCGQNEVFDLGVSELAEVVHYIGEFGVPEENFRIDLTIARGLDYYTGTVYETVINKHPEIGSVCSGGRYDNLAEYYTKQTLPGVGMSIGLTRLFFILNEKEYLNRRFENPVEVLVIPMTSDISNAIQVSGVLRNAGINTQVYMEEKKFKKKMDYANKLSIPYCVLLGEDEIRDNKVSLKNMTTGEQITVEIEEAIAQISAGHASMAAERYIMGMDME